MEKNTFLNRINYLYYYINHITKLDYSLILDFNVQDFKIIVSGPAS